LLLPRDPAKEEAAAAENARKVANGAQQAEPDPQETFDQTFESTFFDDQTMEQDEEIEIPQTEELESSETQDEASQSYEEGSEPDEEED
jgi:hypothetical protein